MPKISAIMPAYNAEKYIGEAIESILNQTFADFEFIIIDDGSTDGTKKIIKEYDDPRIVLLENEKNSGIVVALNKGLDAAKGEYIARMDSDDISLPERFEKQVAFLESHPETVALGVGIRTFGENIEGVDMPAECNPQKSRIDLIFSPCIAHPTAMIRASVLKENNIKYDGKYVGTEDYALWWELSRYGDVHSLQEILFKYRIHTNQVSKNADEKTVGRFVAFANERLHWFGINGEPQVVQTFFDYTNGRADEFSSEDCFTFIGILSKIVKWNNCHNFYNDVLLKNRFGLAALECIQSKRLKNTEAIRIALYANKIGILSMLNLIKALYVRLRI